MQDDQAFITLTGFHVEAFEYLCSPFAPIYEEYSTFVDCDAYIAKKLPKYAMSLSICSGDCLGLGHGENPWFFDLDGSATDVWHNNYSCA